MPKGSASDKSASHKKVSEESVFDLSAPREP